MRIPVWFSIGFFALGCAPPPTPTADDCMMACEGLVARCGAANDCARLCRDLTIVDRDGNDFGCPVLLFQDLVDCARASESSMCAERCGDEVADLMVCNDTFCAMLPTHPGCP